MNSAGSINLAVSQDTTAITPIRINGALPRVTWALLKNNAHLLNNISLLKKPPLLPHQRQKDKFFS
jgi:hypothetical protein